MNYEEENMKENCFEELKRCLFEICKTETDRSSAIEQLVNNHGSLVVNVFGDNPFEVMPELEDFYDYNDYVNPQGEDCRTFAEWSEYFCEIQRDQLSKKIFDLFRKGVPVYDILSVIKSESTELADKFSISSLEDLKEYIESNDYREELIGEERSLLEWKYFFENDELNLYNSCIELTEENYLLTQKLEEIKNIIVK